MKDKLNPNIINKINFIINDRKNLPIDPLISQIISTINSMVFFQ